MKAKRITLFIFLALFPILISAQSSEIKYFEFAPDTSQKFLASRRGEIIQPFVASNDIISGIDVWLDNSNVGSASFALLNNTDQVIASKNVSVPVIPAKWGGERFHIAFNQPVQVSGEQIYKIKITNATSYINIYYTDRVQPLEHNTPYSPLEKIVSPAIISGFEQTFAIKFALYDNSDTLHPVISNITSSISSNVALISFNVNEPADFKVTIESADKSQSQIDPFKNDYQICNQAITTCESNFNVSSNVQYNYQIIAKDQWGNESGFGGTVGISVTSTATSTVADTTPPVISNIQVLFLTDKSALFAWTTNEPANSSVLIGLISKYQIITSIGDATYELEHAINSGNVLAPDTKYFASIISIDPSGNTSNKYFEFTTLTSAPLQENPPPTDETPPQNIPITSPTSTPTALEEAINNTSSTVDQSSQLPLASIDAGIDNQSIDIQWAAPLAEPTGGYRIDIFDANYNLIQKIYVPAGSHNINVKNLSAGEYEAIIYADNNGVFEKVAKPSKFSITSYVNTGSRSTTIYVIITVLLIIACVSTFYFIKKKRLVDKNENV